MARMPGAVWQGEQSPRMPMSRYDIVCIHTIVGFAPAHAAHFSTTGSGRILESRDTRFRSAANLLGNHRVIAIENADHGPEFPAWGGSRVPPLTDAQVNACAKILAWAHRVHDVPLRLCPDSRPSSRGLAYHRQGIDGNFEVMRFRGRLPGGEVWTEHFGKVCPGDNRIAQLPLILGRAITIVRPKEDDDMPLDDDLYRDQRQVTVRNVLQRLDGYLATQAAYRERLRHRIADVRAAVRAGDKDIERRLRALEDAVEAELLEETDTPGDAPINVSDGPGGSG